MNEFYRDYLNRPMDRRGTNCIKWDFVDEKFNGKNLLPVWVADMDYPTVPAVREALVERAQHPIYGYTDNRKAETEAEIGWLKRRYGFDCKAEWMLYSPGVVDSLFFCVQALTEPGDKILINTPVYGPFFYAVQKNRRTLVEVPCKWQNNLPSMDFEAMEEAFKDGVKMMIFCNPHNPLGRVWTEEEVKALVILANRYGVIIVSDEIHSDFIMPGYKHTRILSVEDSERCVMLTSATKSFNLAGLRQSGCIIPDSEIRSKVAHQIELAHASDPNIFGSIAQTAAYNHGDEWMDAVVEMIAENRDYVVNTLKKELPQVKTSELQGTYLLWLDFSALGMEHEQTMRFLVEKAQVALNTGTFFGSLGKGHFRMNLATQRTNLEEALRRIIKAVQER